MNHDPLGGFILLSIRFAFAFGIFVVLAWRDVRKNGAAATKYKEYIFLVASALIAVAFAELHDAVTVRLSPDYFIEGKGLGPKDLHWQVAVLAVKASYWVGLLLGLVYLIANNPYRDYPRLPYRKLYALILLPMACALLLAPVFGFWYQTTIREYGTRFALVWGIHTGTYLGSFLGGVLGLILLVRWRVLAKRTPAKLN